VKEASPQVPLLLAIELALALRSAREPHVAKGNRRKKKGTNGNEEKEKQGGKSCLATANNKRGRSQVGGNLNR
jgi:hypothetical protein